MTEDFQVTERKKLCIERLKQIPQESLVQYEYRDYFKKQSEKLLLIISYADMVKRGQFKLLNTEECEQWMNRLYDDIRPENYETSFSNPFFCGKHFGKRYGKLLAFLAAKWNSLIFYAAEKRIEPIIMHVELFLETYSEFYELDETTVRRCRADIYSFETDYLEYFLSLRADALFNKANSFVKDIIKEASGENLAYLYRYGEYITENEKKIAAFLFAQPEEVIETMAENVVDGYLRGFRMMKIPLKRGQIVSLRYAIGFERVFQRVIELLAEKGLGVTSARTPVNRRHARKTGYTVTNLNIQYDYDHRNDEGLFADKPWYLHQIEMAERVYSEKSEIISKYAGPLVQETFGERQPLPENHTGVVVMDSYQQKMQLFCQTKCREILEKYAPSDKTSFTIVAYPLPSIGEQFAEIFQETIKLNCLDNESYKKVQQCLIDALDQAEAVHVVGKNGNKTDITVQLIPLRDPKKETKFENCTADVNIPVGEVFTSPVLKGTNGVLHVSSVFLGNSEYKNLSLTFVDGKTTEYSCDNFQSKEENAEFLRETLLKNHDWLPIGEFAIGTNTLAYMMGKKYRITEVLPILIAEKTGPHFAIGDTCYSYAEDHKVYNPDGKEIIARENELSALRKNDPEQAYFQCHTDITLPYEELSEIVALCADRSEITIVKDGRFVLPGTEMLNEAFQQE